jgi:hypothetical protein
MTKMRLTAFPIIIIALIVVLASCRRDDVEHQNLYMKTGVVLSGAQETPGTPTSATGTMDVSYSRLSKTLSYTVRWSGLTGPVTNMHIHGLDPIGYSHPGNVFQTFTTNTIRPCTTGGPTSCGTYSGTLFIDGVAIKEVDLLNGMYYVNIHTSVYPNGEIRGQIVFQ